LGPGLTKNRSEAELDEVKINKFGCKIPDTHFHLYCHANFDSLELTRTMILKDRKIHHCDLFAPAAGSASSVIISLFALFN
jgi:hypothetical protein